MRSVLHARGRHLLEAPLFRDAGVYVNDLLGEGSDYRLDELVDATHSHRACAQWIEMATRELMRRENDSPRTNSRPQ